MVLKLKLKWRIAKWNLTFNYLIRRDSLWPRSLWSRIYAQEAIKHDLSWKNNHILYSWIQPIVRNQIRMQPITAILTHMFTGFCHICQIRNGHLTPDNVPCILPPRKGLDPLMYRFLVGCSTDWAFLPNTDVTDCYTSHFKAVDARVNIPRLVRGCKDHDPSRDQFLRRYNV